MAAQGSPPAGLPTAKPPGARGGAGQGSPRERIKAEAAKAAERLMPGAPDAARVAAALSLSGVVVDPAHSEFAQIMSRAAEGYEGWQPGGLETLAGAIQRGAMASPGSLITPRACPAVFAAWDAGLVFEQRALDEACSVLKVDAGAAGLAKALLRSAESTALCSQRSLHGEADPEADLLKAVLECAGADAAAAEQVRAALNSYEEGRARLVRACAEAEVRSQSRNLEVAMALQAWASAREASKDAQGESPPVEAIAMMAMLAPALDAGRDLLAHQARGVRDLEASAPSEVVWCAYVWLVDPAGSRQARDAMDGVRQMSAAVSAEKYGAIAALAAEFRAAEIALLRAAYTAHLAELDRMIDSLKPVLVTSPVTAEAIGQLAAAQELPSEDQARQAWRTVRTQQRERLDAFRGQVQAIADAP